MSFSRFVTQELWKLQKQAREKWGFDFQKETPLESSRFEWISTKPQPSVYALTHAAHVINRHLDDECTNSGAISDIESPEHLLDERASRANSYREPTKHFCDTTESSSSRTSLIKPTAFKPVTLNNIASSSSTSTNEIITRSKPSRRLSTPSPKQKQQEKRQPKITGESPNFLSFFCLLHNVQRR